MEPEFIAWDKEKKVWVPADAGDNGLWFIYLAHDGTVWKFECGAMKPALNITIYQYIGRNDKHGEKIYEGSEIIGNDGKIYVVYYDINDSSFKAKNTLETGTVWDTIYLSQVFGGIKVIGHIAEGNGK